jgi:hypothetical protein
LIDQWKDAKYFTKLDLRSGYHQIRIAEGDTCKTTFKTKQGLFEWMVMPFGLCTTPATFMRVMNDVLRPFLDDCVIVYLGHIVGGRELKIDPSKVKVILEWSKPNNVTEVRIFLGETQYWRKFIANFSSIAAPLHAMTSINQVFQWGGKQQKAFDTLKEKISSPPFLALPNLRQPFEIQIDASNYAMGAVLLQHGVESQKCRISIHLSLHQSSHFIAPLTFHDTIFIIKYGLNLIIFQIIYFSIKREFVIKY